MDDAIVNVWTDVTSVSLVSDRTGVDDERAKVCCGTESGVDTIKDIDKSDGEEDKVVDTSEVDLSWYVEVLVNGKLDENWKDCDTEGGGNGDPEEDESSTDPVSAPTGTKTFGILMVDV